MAKNSTLHVKIAPEILANLKELAKEREQTMGELVRQALDSCYQLDLLNLSEEQKQALSAYKGGFISIGKLAELMGHHVLQMRSWLKEHGISQNVSLQDMDVKNA